MTTEKIIISIILIAITTFATRAFPFVILGNRKIPDYILYLGKYLPPAIICAIIVYCFKDVNFLSGSHGLSEIIAVIAVILLQLKFKNTMISISVSTIIYMVMVQFVMV